MQGNSNVSVGEVASVEVLWETYNFPPEFSGTTYPINVGDYVNNVSYADGYITFIATAKEGNALIAAKDAEGTILWSWHIWKTAQPAEQEYKNGAGIMMDRNLGALRAGYSNPRHMGLLYQWGRKDPFLSTGICNKVVAVGSTATWPAPVASNATTGTLEYAQQNPMTFITENKNNYDWLYGASKEDHDDTRWQSTKTKYDPCPPGWRVPDGGGNGIWVTALGSSSTINNSALYYKYGTNFTGLLGKNDIEYIWYPAVGYIQPNDGAFNYPGWDGYYWSVSTGTDTSTYGYNAHKACPLHFDNSRSGAWIYPWDKCSRALGASVRCCKE